MLILTAITFRFVYIVRGRRLGFLFGHFFLEELGEGQRLSPLSVVRRAMVFSLSSDLSVLCGHRKQIIRAREHLPASLNKLMAPVII